MGRRRRFCNCRLWRLPQPFDERLRFDEASRRRRRRHGRSRTDEAYEELRVLSIDSPTLHVVHRCSSRVCFCALTFDLTGLPKASPVEGRVRPHWAEDVIVGLESRAAASLALYSSSAPSISGHGVRTSYLPSRPARQMPPPAE